MYDLRYPRSKQARVSCPNAGSSTGRRDQGFHGGSLPPSRGRTPRTTSPGSLSAHALAQTNMSTKWPACLKRQGNNRSHTTRLGLQDHFSLEPFWQQGSRLKPQGLWGGFQVPRDSDSGPGGKRDADLEPSYRKFQLAQDKETQEASGCGSKKWYQNATLVIGTKD